MGLSQFGRDFDVHAGHITIRICYVSLDQKKIEESIILRGPGREELVMSFHDDL